LHYPEDTFKSEGTAAGEDDGVNLWDEMERRSGIRPESSRSATSNFNARNRSPLKQNDRYARLILRVGHMPNFHALKNRPVHIRHPFPSLPLANSWLVF
jgi:hypothetical protein